MSNALMHANVGTMVLATCIIKKCGSVEASIRCVGRWPAQTSACLERTCPKRHVVDDCWALGDGDAGPPSAALTCVGAGLRKRRLFGTAGSRCPSSYLPTRPF